ncbi:MAG: hypothetical protein GY754_37015 [bacterium]|nr:hypothetical protein [bacterium]
MTGKVIAGAALSVVGILSSVLGILFLIASKSVPSRATIGIILLGSGVVELIFGIRFFRQGIEASPAGMRRRMLKLAAKNNGILWKDTILAEFGDSPDVEFRLNELIASKTAEKETRDNGTCYIFPALQMRMITKVCPYCGNDYPIRDDIESCPSCGGDLKMAGSKRSGSGELFGMDD